MTGRPGTLIVVVRRVEEGVERLRGARASGA